MTIAELAAELASLYERLPEAIEKDNTGEGGIKAIAAGVPVNAEVLHAIVTLHREIPAATMAAAERVGEPWQHREIPECLIAIPRFAARMHDLAMAKDERFIEDAVRYWLRTVKLALNLRTRDMPIGAACPRCGEGKLFAAGSEAFARQKRDEVTIEWEHAGLIFCSFSCSPPWPESEWTFLGRQLEEIASEAQQAS